jgi:hypothetical protein
MPNLEPNIFLGQGPGRIGHDVLEAIQALLELLLLFVYYA